PMAGEPSPVGGDLAFLDPLLSGAALVVEADDGPVPPAHRGDDEAHPGEEVAEMMLDLRDHAAWAVPGGSLVRIGFLNDLFYDLAISHDRQRCQFLFLLDEKPTVCAGRLGRRAVGRQAEGFLWRRSV